MNAEAIRFRGRDTGKDPGKIEQYIDECIFATFRDGSIVDPETDTRYWPTPEAFESDFAMRFGNGNGAPRSAENGGVKVDSKDRMTEEEVRLHLSSSRRSGKKIEKRIAKAKLEEVMECPEAWPKIPANWRIGTGACSRTRPKPRQMN